MFNRFPRSVRAGLNGQPVAEERQLAMERHFKMGIHSKFSSMRAGSTVMKYYSQKEQDKWVIEEVFHGKRDGYFLDLAATDGIYLNNTFVLETQYGWNGLCIEANPFFFNRLNVNRRCIRTDKCIDGKPGEVEFVLFNELGGIIDEDTDNNMAI